MASNAKTEVERIRSEITDREIKAGVVPPVEIQPAATNPPVQAKEPAPPADPGPGVKPPAEQPIVVPAAPPGPAPTPIQQEPPTAPAPIPPQAVAPVIPAAPTAPGMDYKALYELELERKQAQSETFVRTRARNQILENELMQLRGSIGLDTTGMNVPGNGQTPYLPNPQLPPVPAHDPAGSPPPPVVPPPTDPGTAKAREELVADYGEEWIGKFEKVFGHTPISTEELTQMIQQAIEPALKPFQQSFAQMESQRATEEGMKFDLGLSQHHPAWKETLESQHFQQWLFQQPFGARYWSALYPETEDEGGYVSEYVFVLDAYRDALPETHADAAQRAEMERRAQAVAATSQGDINALQPDNGGSAEHITMSEVMRKRYELANNPTELIAFNKKVTDAQMSGTFINDLMDPQAYSGGVTP